VESDGLWKVMDFIVKEINQQRTLKYSSIKSHTLSLFLNTFSPFSIIYPCIALCICHFKKLKKLRNNGGAY
jgi:hypothetical protein